jgi:hypothetical protein
MRSPLRDGGAAAHPEPASSPARNRSRGCRPKTPRACRQRWPTRWRRGTPAQPSMPPGGRATSALTVVRLRCRGAAIVQDFGTRPLPTMVTVSRTFPTLLRMCEDSSAVRPAALASRTGSVKTASMSGSRAEVSSVKVWTSDRNVATSAAFRRLPHEYVRAPSLSPARSTAAFRPCGLSSSPLRPCRGAAGRAR